MSGGHFDNYQWYIDIIANSIEDYINGHSIDEEDIERYIYNHCLEDNEKEYILKNKHTIPNKYNFNENTIEEFKKGLDILRKAFIYTQKIDWLLSGDNGEENFHKKLKEELDNLNNKKNGTNKTNTV